MVAINNSVPLVMADTQYIKQRDRQVQSSLLHSIAFELERMDEHQNLHNSPQKINKNFKNLQRSSPQKSSYSLRNTSPHTSPHASPMKVYNPQIQNNDELVKRHYKLTASALPYYEKNYENNEQDLEKKITNDINDQKKGNESPHNEDENKKGDDINELSNISASEDESINNINKPIDKQHI